MSKFPEMQKYVKQKRGIYWTFKDVLFPDVLDDPEVTANIYYKSRNVPNTDTQNYSTDLR